MQTLMSAPERMPASDKGGGAAAAEQRPVHAVFAPAPHQAAPSGQKRKRSARRVVWVKYGMQPYWPALVADPSDDDVPPCTLTRPPDDVVPVRYFGDGCWQWVSATKCVDFKSYYEQHANAPAAVGRPEFLRAVAEAMELLAKRKRMKEQSAAKPGAADGGARTTTTTMTPSVHQVQRPQAPPASPVTAAAQPAPASVPPVREPPRAQAAPAQAASPAFAAPASAPASPPVPQPPRAQPRPAQAASPAAVASPPAQAESREVTLLRLQLKRKRAEMARHASEAARHAAEAAFHAAEAECIDIEIKLASLV